MPVELDPIGREILICARRIAMGGTPLALSPEAGLTINRAPHLFLALIEMLKEEVEENAA